MSQAFGYASMEGDKLIGCGEDCLVIDVNGKQAVRPRGLCEHFKERS